MRSKKASDQSMIVARLEPDEDLVKGLKKIAKRFDITSGSIVSLIGSLKRSNFVYPIIKKGSEYPIEYSEPQVVEGPLEFLSGQGTIGMGEDPIVHLHGIISDKDMKVYGGHFLEDGNPVFATMEVLIVSFENVQIVRELEETVGLPIFQVIDEQTP